ncbi:MAG: hypothetical protein ABI789_07630 [Usitatibacter sp.]
MLLLADANDREDGGMGHTLFTISVVAFMVVVAAKGARQHWRKTRALSMQPEIESTVISSERFRMVDAEFNGFRIETRFDVPGRGVLTHEHFASEGKAILFSRIHKVGSRHRVIPSLDAGKAFLPQDFERQPPPDVEDSPLALLGLSVIIVILFLGAIVYGVVKVFSER